MKKLIALFLLLVGCQEDYCQAVAEKTAKCYNQSVETQEVRAMVARCRLEWATGDQATKNKANEFSKAILKTSCEDMKALYGNNP